MSGRRKKPFALFVTKQWPVDKGNLWLFASPTGSRLGLMKDCPPPTKRHFACEELFVLLWSYKIDQRTAMTGSYHFCKDHVIIM